MQISDAISDFILAKKANGRAPQTISDYHRCLNPFADWCNQQHLDTDTLTRSDFRRYVADELRTRGWAESTIAIYVRALRCFLRWSYTEGYTETNVATAISAPPGAPAWSLPY